MKFAKKKARSSLEKKRTSFGKLRKSATDFFISSRIAKEAWKLRILWGGFSSDDEAFAFLVFEVGSKRGVQGSKNQFVGRYRCWLFLCCLIVAQDVDCTRLARALMKQC